MMPTPSVQILLSTYNGQQYLREQLDSLLQQTYPHIDILIRDDGSQDNTIDIIQTYAQKYKNIHLIAGDNRGVVASFFALLRAADSPHQYFAFCDQDDIWEAYKVERAIMKLQDISKNIPSLYASRTTLVNDSNHVIGITSVPKKPLGLAHALVQNRLIGNTMIFNKVARDLALSCSVNLENVLMHDWWLYLTVGTFGRIIFDDKPVVRYRQHNSNVVGNRSDSLQVRFQRFIENKRNCTRQAEEFRKCFYTRMDKPQQHILDRFLDERSSFQRIRYALTSDVYRQTTLDNLILRVLIILNRI